MTKELSDFQKAFLLGQGAGQTLFTQKEFDTALAEAKAEIMTVAIETTKAAIAIERRRCAETVMRFAKDAEGDAKDALEYAASVIIEGDGHDGR